MMTIEPVIVEEKINPYVNMDTIQEDVLIKKTPDYFTGWRHVNAPPGYRIVVSGDVYLRVIGWQAREGETYNEINGLAGATDGTDGERILIDKICFMAKGDPGFVKYSAEQEASATVAAINDGWMPNIQWHTHPTFSAYFSGTDNSAQSDRVSVGLLIPSGISIFLVFGGNNKAMARVFRWSGDSREYFDIAPMILVPDGEISMEETERPLTIIKSSKTDKDGGLVEYLEKAGSRAMSEEYRQRFSKEVYLSLYLDMDTVISDWAAGDKSFGKLCQDIAEDELLDEAGISMNRWDSYPVRFDEMDKVIAEAARIAHFICEPEDRKAENIVRRTNQLRAYLGRAYNIDQNWTIKQMYNTIALKEASWINFATAAIRSALMVYISQRSIEISSAKRVV